MGSRRPARPTSKTSCSRNSWRWQRTSTRPLFVADGQHLLARHSCPYCCMGSGGVESTGGKRPDLLEACLGRDHGIAASCLEIRQRAHRSSPAGHEEDRLVLGRAFPLPPDLPSHRPADEPLFLPKQPESDSILGQARLPATSKQEVCRQAWQPQQQTPWPDFARAYWQALEAYCPGARLLAIISGWLGMDTR